MDMLFSGRAFYKVENKLIAVIEFPEFHRKGSRFVWEPVTNDKPRLD